MAPKVTVAGVSLAGPTWTRLVGTTWHSAQVTEVEMAAVPGRRWPWWAPTPGRSGLVAPFRVTGGAAFRMAGAPGGRARVESPWQAAQLVARSGAFRLATPFTWRSRLTVVLVKPGWQSAHSTAGATAGCQAVVSIAPPGAAWQAPQPTTEGGFHFGS